MQETLINAFTRSEIKELFDDMYMDDTVDIIEEMPANVVEQILDVTDRETRQIINRLLKISGRQCGKHHDSGICGPEKKHDCRTGTEKD